MSAADHTSAALTRTLTRIDTSVDRAMYSSPDYGSLARDLDLARWAGLAEPRTIRRSIAAALRDGSVILAGGGMTPPATDAAIVVEYHDHVPRGDRGAVQEVRGWYLSEAAALIVAARLRTAPAQSLTRAALAAFASTRRTTVPAALAPAPAVPAASVSDLDRLVASVATLASVVGQLASTVATMQAAPALPAPAPVVPAPPPAAHVEPTPPPESWLSPTSIATRATHAIQRPVSAQRVGRTLTTLGVRERGPSVARCIMLSVTTRGGQRDVAAWRYAPAVLAEVVASIREEDERVRAGAAGVLAALQAASLDADARQIPLPLTRPSAIRRAA